MLTHAALLSKMMIGLFVTSVIVWYLYTPYLVEPHPQIEKDILAKVKLAGRPEPSSTTLQIENFSKWLIYVNSSLTDTPQVVYGHSIGNIKFDKSAVMYMEWRSEQVVHVEQKGALIDVTRSAPEFSGSTHGIYNHFNVKVPSDKKKTVQIVPRFLFGLENEVAENLYGGDVSKFPISGVFSHSTKVDRFLIQMYMVLVTLSVVFLLWAHNSPSALVTEGIAPASSKKTS